MINVLIDGNFLMHKTKHAYISYNKYPDLTTAFEEPENRAEFFRKVITDLCYTLNKIKDVKRVVIVFDSSECWRKEVYPGYKLREKDDTDQEGWTHFYNIMEKLANLFSKRGFIVSRKEGLEGDDLLYIWSHLLSEQDEKSIVVTGDRDMLQLLDEYIGVYNNNSLKNDFFGIDDSIYNQYIVQGKKGANFTQLIPNIFLFRKILVGDAGDCVPNVIRGLGDKTADKITASAASYDLVHCEFDREDYDKQIALLVSSAFKRELDENELENNINRNIRLMWLDSSVYPTELLKETEEHVFDLLDNYKFKSEFNLGNILKQE